MTERDEQFKLGARHALGAMLNVLDAWVSGARENHEALGHRGEPTGDECWNSFHPDDIRRMVEDAAQDCNVASPAAPKPALRTDDGRWPVAAPPNRPYDRVRMIREYLRPHYPAGKVPADSADLDLPSDVDIAWYEIVEQLANLHDLNDTRGEATWSDAVRCIGSLVERQRGSVLERCAEVLGVPASDLGRALDVCPDFVGQLFGHSPAAGKVRAVAAVLGVDQFQVREALATAPNEVRRAFGLEDNDRAAVERELERRETLRNGSWDRLVEVPRRTPPVLDLARGDRLLLMISNTSEGVWEPITHELSRMEDRGRQLLAVDTSLVDQVVILRAGADVEAQREDKHQFGDAAVELARLWRRIEPTTLANPPGWNESVDLEVLGDLIATEVLRLGGALPHWETNPTQLLKLIESAVNLAQAWRQLDDLAGRDCLVEDQAEAEREIGRRANAMAHQVLLLAGIEDAEDQS